MVEIEIDGKFVFVPGEAEDKKKKMLIKHFSVQEIPMCDNIVARKKLTSQQEKTKD